MTSDASVHELDALAQRVLAALSKIDEPDAWNLTELLDNALAHLQTQERDSAALALYHLKAGLTQIGRRETTPAWRIALALGRAFSALAPPAAECVIVEDGVAVFVVDWGGRALDSPGVTPLHAALAVERQQRRALADLMRADMADEEVRLHSLRDSVASATAVHQDRAAAKREQANRWFQIAHRREPGCGRARLVELAKECLDEQRGLLFGAMSGIDDAATRERLDRRRRDFDDQRKLLTLARARHYLEK